MSGQPTPVKLVEAFAINAAPAYITKPFPVPSQIPGGNPGKASLNDGFTPLNMTPITGGGIPVSGADMNGICYLLSTTIAAVDAGQVFYPFDAVYAAAIGGYAVGATLQSVASLLQRWTNTLDGNTADPAADPSRWVSSVPLYATSAPTAGAHADNILPGPSDYVLDFNTAAGAVTLNGFVAQRDGQRLIISNTGANPLNIGALVGTAANQVRMSFAVTLLQNDSITIQYNTTLARWVQA